MRHAVGRWCACRVINCVHIGDFSRRADAAPHGECMKRDYQIFQRLGLCVTSMSWALLGGHAAWAEEHQIYRCGTNYNNTMSAKEAAAKGCKTIEGAPITVIQSIKHNKPAGKTQGEGGSASRPEDKVDPADQRARDNDARRILEQELSKEQAALAEMEKAYNNGEPEKQGPEAKNYQKYLDRVAEMKAAIERKKADIEAIQRELAKMPGTLSGSP